MFFFFFLKIIGIEGMGEKRSFKMYIYIHPLFFSPYLYSVLVILPVYSSTCVLLSIDYTKSLLSA